MFFENIMDIYCLHSVLWQTCDSDSVAQTDGQLSHKGQWKLVTLVCWQTCDQWNS